jgi:hypothetical protein
MEYNDLLDQAIKEGRLPPETIYPVTEKQWNEGYDPTAFSTNGKTPATKFCKLRRHVLYAIVKWSLSVVSKYCPMCMELLWAPEHLNSPQAIHERMAELDFDHCVPKLKDADYSRANTWVGAPLVHQMTTEEKSGCFCHKKCHFRGDNMTG